MNSYIAYYGNNVVEVHSHTTMEARDKAISLFQTLYPRRRIKPFEVTVLLTEKDSTPVVQTLTL